MTTLGIVLAHDVSTIRIHDGIVSRLLTRVAGAAAITLGRRILLSKAASDALRRGGDDAFELLAHELVHVVQMGRRGLAAFLVSYVSEYLGRRFRGLGHRQAYRALSAEIEARRLARLCARVRNL